ncbi:hypothetical protein FRX31_030312 [Thalictrum thalictroides]|uniref:Uncharacterized protein n=1 Tax=Thalictrum thalictroides TaxID=46969 RepID=A0A7J6V7B5_THATH|nr:hypothetical protein FRX31_030312 [Thalictrum thalictroides]
MKMKVRLNSIFKHYKTLGGFLTFPASAPQTHKMDNRKLSFRMANIMKVEHEIMEKIEPRVHH